MLVETFSRSLKLLIAKNCVRCCWFCVEHLFFIARCVWYLVFCEFFSLQKKFSTCKYLWCHENASWLPLVSEAYSQSSKTSKMKLFAKIVNSWKPSTIFAKSSILDVWRGPENVFITIFGALKIDLKRNVDWKVLRYCKTGNEIVKRLPCLVSYKHFWLTQQESFALLSRLC